MYEYHYFKCGECYLVFAVRGFTYYRYHCPVCNLTVERKTSEITGEQWLGESKLPGAEDVKGILKDEGVSDGGS